MSTLEVTTPITTPAVTPPETERADRHAHIIKFKDKLTEAIINSTPVEALCGHVFVPNRNPNDFPVCSKCKQAYDFGEEFGFIPNDDGPRYDDHHSFEAE